MGADHEQAADPTPHQDAPFNNALPPDDLERLCLWLVRRQGFERAEYLGAADSE